MRNAHYPEHRNILAEIAADAQDALEEMDATSREAAERDYEEATTEAWHDHLAEMAATAAEFDDMGDL